MKKCTSVLMLYARSTIFRLLGILTAAGMIETILFLYLPTPLRH